MTQTRRLIGTLVAAVTIGAMLVAVRPAGATTTPPPPVSNLRVTSRGYQTITATWSVPAAVYDPGAKIVALWRRGSTPPQEPVRRLVGAGVVRRLPACGAVRRRACHRLHARRLGL